MANRSNTIKRILPANKKNLVSHYVSIITKRLSTLKAMVKYLVADGYFMKHAFIVPLVKKDSMLLPTCGQMPYRPVKKRIGHPKQYAGKVVCHHINKPHIKKLTGMIAEITTLA